MFASLQRADQIKAFVSKFWSYICHVHFDIVYQVNAMNTFELICEGYLL